MRNSIRIRRAHVAALFEYQLREVMKRIEKRLTKTPEQYQLAFDAMDDKDIAQRELFD
jgi:hypothetical protein